MTGSGSDQAGTPGARGQNLLHLLEDGDTVALTARGPSAALELLPGTVLLNRYRIVAKLGLGGMGEVYRADDLKLGQPVALKFLKPDQTMGEQHQQLIAEVRLGREVAHPNVCRIYDLGEVEGQAFISMEYIDGEDLASLLRRIGRLTGDKALFLARDICSGLAAIHACGILHRDLKPANIMIDGRGRARITDFGLASAEDRPEGAALIVGTPAYMAPELLRGRPATVQSDLFALGLVLFEIGSGRKVYTGTSLPEILEQHRSEASRESLEKAPELAGAVSAVIAHCLAADPTARPLSAEAVLAGLPAKDALSAAIAAGETPTPGMVAAGGEKGDLTRTAAWSLIALAFLTLLLMAGPGRQATLVGRIPLPHPPEQLERRALEMITAAGWDASRAPKVDQTSWFHYDEFYLRWRDRQRPDASLDPTMMFVFRQSPRPMHGTPSFYYHIWHASPLFEVPGMIKVVLSSDARLNQLVVLAPAGITSAEPAPPPWPQLLTFAGLASDTLVPTTPVERSPVDNDLRAAWVGKDPLTGVPLRVEAAALQGLPVWFRVIRPWDQPRAQLRAQGVALGSAMVAVLLSVLLVVALFLARRNLRRGQGDRKGAFHLACFTLAASVASQLLYARHRPDFGLEADIAQFVTANGLFAAAAMWFGYIALEPFARRRWPKILISWNRLLVGRVLDPMVGRDLLVGLAGGGVAACLLLALSLLPARLGLEHSLPLRGFGSPEFTGIRDVLSLLLYCVLEAIGRAAGFLACLVLLRGLLRNQAAALVLTCVLFGMTLVEYGTGPDLFRVATGLAMTPILAFLLFRFGLLAFCSGALMLALSTKVPLTLDPASWYFGQSLFTLVVVSGLALFGFWRSLGGKSLLPGPVFED